jgi:hypothetical protein
MDNRFKAIEMCRRLQEESRALISRLLGLFTHLKQLERVNEGINPLVQVQLA